VALTWRPLQAEQTQLERLGGMPMSVYAGVRHPLATNRKPTPSQIAASPFVVSQLEGPHAGWPRERTRSSRMHVDGVGLAAELCARGDWLAVLPDVVAIRHGELTGAPLVRLPAVGIRPLEVYALWRVPLDLPGRADALVAALRACMSELEGQAAN
jgi:hypothetical protein